MTTREQRDAERAEAQAVAAQINEELKGLANLAEPHRDLKLLAYLLDMAKHQAEQLLVTLASPEREP